MKAFRSVLWGAFALSFASCFAPDFNNPVDPLEPGGFIVNLLLQNNLSRSNSGSPGAACHLPPDGAIDLAANLYFSSVLLDSAGCPAIFLTQTDNSTFAEYRRFSYSGSWSNEIVSTGRFGFKDSILLDAMGVFHLALVNYPATSTLYYSTISTGSYAEQSVPASAPDTAYLEIALDTAGKAHITSLDYASRIRFYSTNASGSWVTATISSDSLASASIATDPAFPPSIVYYKWSSRDVYFADASNWAATTMLEDYSIDNGPSPVLKVYNGKRYTAYAYSNDGGYLNGYLVVNDDSTGSWVKTYLESGTTRPIGVDLLLDSSGKQHVVSCNRLGDMKYYSNKSGSWQSSLLGSGICLNNSMIETIFFQDRILVLYQAPDSRTNFRSFRPADYP